MQRNAYAFNQGILTSNQPWQSWERHSRTAAKRLADETGRVAGESQVDFAKFTPKKYLLSWATIVAGVEPEKNGYWIHPEHTRWANDNGNAWLNQVLLESYKSFIMAENYLEHIQIPALSKGKVLDAVAWVARDKKLPTVFVDILVATDKKRHRALVKDILDDKINTMSMGCNITHSQCSKCGEIFEEGEDQCEHINEQLGKKFTENRTKRIIAELCGVPGQPGTCEFIEASWVAVPAFSPAVRHDSLKIGDEWLGKPLRAFVPKVRMSTANPEW